MSNSKQIIFFSFQMSVSINECCCLIRRPKTGLCGWCCNSRPLTDILITVLIMGGTFLGLAAYFYIVNPTTLDLAPLGIFSFSVGSITVLIGLLMACFAQCYYPDDEHCYCNCWCPWESFFYPCRHRCIYDMYKEQVNSTMQTV